MKEKKRKEKKRKEKLDWIHKVRENNYKVSKNMSSKEYIEYIEKQATKVLDEITRRRKIA